MLEICSVKPENTAFRVVSPLQEHIVECKNIAAAGLPPQMKDRILVSCQTGGKNAALLETSLHFKYS